eukprot:340629-Hanusia_phi.AAC.9
MAARALCRDHQRTFQLMLPNLFMYKILLFGLFFLNSLTSTAKNHVLADVFHVNRSRTSLQICKMRPRSYNPNIDITQEGVSQFSWYPRGQPLLGATAGWLIGKESLTFNLYVKGEQPHVALVNGNLDILSNVETTMNVSLYNNPGCGFLAGTTSVRTTAGVAIFTDLMISRSGYPFQLKFEAGATGGPVVFITPYFRVRIGQIFLPYDPIWNPIGHSISTYPNFSIPVCPSSQCPTSCSCRIEQISTRHQVVAGTVIKSVEDQSLHECSGFQFPTMWVRTYDLQNRTIGVECDGWQDRLDWSYNFTIIAGPVPYCVLRDPLAQIEVCLQGFNGTRTQPSVNGRATFTDLVIWAAGYSTFTFGTLGMNSTTFDIYVVHAEANSILILRQPPTASNVGTYFTVSQSPIVNLVDQFNNSVTNSNWQVYVYSYQNKTNFTRPNVVAPFTFQHDGLAKFTDMSLQTAGSVVLKFYASNETNATLPYRIGPTISSPIFLYPGYVQQIKAVSSTTIIQPVPEPWKPTTSLAAQVLFPQPAISFLDRFGNLVSFGGINVTVSLTAASGIGVLVGNNQAPSNKGFAVFTNLLITSKGIYYLFFSAKTMFLNVSVIVSPGRLRKLLWDIEPTSIPATRKCATQCGTYCAALTSYFQTFHPNLRVNFTDEYLNPVTASGAYFMVDLYPRYISGPLKGTSVDVSKIRLTCKNCFNSNLLIQAQGDQRYLVFTDLAISLACGTDYAVGLALRITAVQLSKCQNVGGITPIYDCNDPSSHIYDGVLVQNITTPFNVYNISSLSLLPFGSLFYSGK